MMKRFGFILYVCVSLAGLFLGFLDVPFARADTGADPELGLDFYIYVSVWFFSLLFLVVQLFVQLFPSFVAAIKGE